LFRRKNRGAMGNKRMAPTKIHGLAESLSISLEPHPGHLGGSSVSIPLLISPYI
jgi:hypothetical protein